MKNVSLLRAAMIGLLVGVGLLLAGGCANKRIDFTEETLENGLRVVYAPLHNAPVVHVRVLYHVGSKDERPDRQGFAHLFEHMMFRGSRHVKPEQHMRLIQTVGGYSNAFTSFDQTVYVNTLPSNQLELALWLEADRMASFKVSEEIYDTERKVVYEEWGRRQNQPYGTSFQDFLKTAFTTHSYRWTPIGDMDHLRAAGVDDLQEFFNTYYVPNNAALVIAGDIDPDAARAMARKYFAWIPRGADVKRLAQPEPPQSEARRAESPQVVPLPALGIGYHVPGHASEDRHALSLLASILGAGNASRMDTLLVNNPAPLCRDVSVMNYALEDSGLFYVSATVLAGKDTAEVEKQVIAALRDVADKGVSDEELSRVKMQARVSEVTGRQTAEQLASQLGQALVFGRDANRVNTELAKIEAVTPADVQAAARKYLQADRSTTLWVRPIAKSPTSLPAGATSGVVKGSGKIGPRAVTFPAGYPTEPPIGRELLQPRFEKGVETMIDGVKVVVMTDTRLPLATWSLTLRRGSHVEPDDKVGLGGLTASLAERGAGDLNYLAMSKDLESRGITLNLADGGDYTRLTGSCLVEQLEHAMRRSADILRRPRFDADEFTRLKEQTFNDLKQRFSNPESAASMELSQALYGASPLGRRASPKTVASITLDDIKAFHKSVYRATDAILLIAGDVTPHRGQELARGLLSGWERGELPKPAYNLPPAAAKRRIILIDRPEGRQSLIRMAVRAYTLHNDQKFAGSVMDRILSHGIDSRLGRYVRAEKGYAYSVWAMFRPSRLAGEFVGGTETSFKTTADAIEAMFKVFGDIRSADVTDAELSETRLRMVGSLVLGMQTIQQQANYRVDGILNGYPLDYFDRYPQRINAVSKQDIRSVAREYLRDDRMTVVVVAPASAVQEQLQRLGEVEVIPMPSKRPELAGGK